MNLESFVLTSERRVGQVTEFRLRQSEGIVVFPLLYRGKGEKESIKEQSDRKSNSFTE